MEGTDRKSVDAPAAGKRSISPTAVLKGGGERPNELPKTPAKPAERKARPSSPKKGTREGDNKVRKFTLITVESKFNLLC